MTQPGHVQSSRPDRKFGLVPSNPDKPRLRLAAFLKSGYTGTVPPVIDYASKIRSWPMAKNDTLGDCITPQTRVLTESLEWVPAGTIRPGDRLLGFDEESKVSGADGHLRGRWFTKALVERADIVKRPCYELELSDGTVVQSSAGHRWLVRSTVQGELGCQRWERTEDLRPGAPRQSKIVKPLSVWETDQSWHSGYLAAAFDGEGHLEQRRRANRVAFNQTANAMLEQVQASLKELGFEFNHEIHSRHKLLRADGTPRKEMHTLRIGKRADFLEFMGRVRPRRLLESYDVASLGRIPGDVVSVVRKTYLGERDVVMLDTSSRTYFAEGMASHNCTAADAAHQLQVWTTYGQGNTITPTDDQVIAFYSGSTGYIPGDPSTDQGGNLQDVCAYFRKVGIAGHKAAAFFEVDPAVDAELRAALWLFGGVAIGFGFPSFAMDQFDQHLPWDISGRNTQIEGGHDVLLVGKNAKGNYQVVTWGRVQEVTPAFWSEYMAPSGNEAWCRVSQEWVKNNQSPEGLDVASLNAAFLSITGEPGPFVQPAPAPSPAPKPAPKPAPSPADKALAAAVHTWLTNKGL